MLCSLYCTLCGVLTIKIIIKVCNENPIHLFHTAYQMVSTGEHTLRL